MASIQHAALIAGPALALLLERPQSQPARAARATAKGTSSTLPATTVGHVLLRQDRLGEGARQRRGKGPVGRAPTVSTSMLSAACGPTFADAGGTTTRSLTSTVSRTPTDRMPATCRMSSSTPMDTGALNGTTDRVTVTDGPATLFDPDGSAFIIHANPDDQVTECRQWRKRRADRLRGHRAMSDAVSLPVAAATSDEPGAEAGSAIRRAVAVHPRVAVRRAEARLRDHDRRRGDLRIAARAGTLYGALARLERRGLIEALEPEDRRRPYRLTGARAPRRSRRSSTGSPGSPGRGSRGSARGRRQMTRHSTAA